MRLLAIETSCDETGIAVVDGIKTETGFSFSIVANTLLSQATMHAEYGGVYPALAKREHLKNLPILLRECLRTIEGVDITTENSITYKNETFVFPPKPDTIEAIAVTYGPGLEPALWTGIVFAEALARAWELPLVPTNHMEGHLLSSLAQKGMLEQVDFPVLGLLISGGHTEFVVSPTWFEYNIIGETLDDAVGEAFDKVARMLEYPYPGGPHISKHAERARNEQLISSTSLPRPMLHTQNCDVSFSGLKTAALYALRGKTLSEDEKAAFAREFEEAVGDVLVAKTRKALHESMANTFVIGGGVAANTFLRARLETLLADEFPSVIMRLPELSITGDNAIMIAEAALAHLLSGRAVIATGPIEARGQLSISTGK